MENEQKWTAWRPYLHKRDTYRNITLTETAVRAVNAADETPVQTKGWWTCRVSCAAAEYVRNFRLEDVANKLSHSAGSSCTECLKCPQPALKACFKCNETKRIAQNNFTVDAESKYITWLTENLYQMKLGNFHRKPPCWASGAFASTGKGREGWHHTETQPWSL